MTERYGELLASFIEADDPTHDVITVNGSPTMGGIVRAEVIRKLGQMQRGRMTLEKVEGWEQYVVAGRICSLFQRNQRLNDSGGFTYREMGTFLVQSVRERLDEKGRETVEVSGLGPEHLLTKERMWEPIGSETVITAALDEDVPGPWTTTASLGCPMGSDGIWLTDDSDIEEGDEIRIQMNNGAWHVAKTTTSSNVVEFTPRILGNADLGNTVELRKGRVLVADVAGLAAGQRAVVSLNSGSLETVIDEVDLDTNEIVLRSGLPGAADTGKAVTVYDYSEPATDDVTQVMAGAAQWSVRFQVSGAAGTAAGTSHAPVGESVFDLLNTIAEQTGEMWRFDDLEYGYLPQKQVFWFRVWDQAPPSLYLRLYSADVATDAENVNRAVVYSLERERTNDIVTRVFPVAADGRVDLSYCTPSLVSSAATLGFTVVVNDDLYEPDYVEYGPGVSQYGVQETTFRFSNVTLAKDTNFTELRQAADTMLSQTMTLIYESQGREFWRARVQSHRPIYPGQALELYNQTGMGPGTASTYFVLEARESYDAGGVIMTDLRLSTTPYVERTAVKSLGRQLQSVEMAGRRPVTGGAGAGGGGAVVPGSGGDHGALTGLTDDDHPQYLLASGTRPLTGNLAASAGVTVDGVDISAHAADPAAHHALVTAGDASMTVSGQAIRIADAAAGDGLGLASGVLSVKTAVSQGTSITGDTVGVYVAGEGGLQVTSSGVGIKRPANSGIGLSALGASLVPATVGASSVSGNVGNEHTHAVESAEDSKTTPGRLMKASADGDHRLRYLTADRVQTPLLLSSADLTIDPGSGVLSVDGNLTFTGGSRSVNTASGDLTLAPAGELQIDPASNVAEVQPSVTLKTAHWASGFLGTGWGLSYDGHLDARSIYADEMHVMAFIADTARVAISSHYVTPGAALLATDFTVPAVGTTGTLVVEDAPGLTGAVFDNNDWVLLRVMNRAGGGLLVANVWGQVSGYVDGPEEGQQSWTFTTKSTTAAGQVVAGGTEALGFGKSGAGWWWVTTNDPAGSPYAGITTWQGTDPYTAANRTHQLRMGQLKGVTGVNEWGLRAGPGTSRHVKFSDLGSEIHGSRLSLYAGDGAQLRVAAAEVRLYRDVSNYSTLLPNADYSAVNVVSTSGLYYSTIDEGVGSYSTADYVANDTNTSGVLFVGLSDPSPWGGVYSATMRAAVTGSGFSNDTVKLFAQVFASDEMTPLTSERLVYTMTGNTSVSVEGSFSQVDTAATQSQWNGARLRLRWEYAINAGEEAIRLDPQVPSLAVGRSLPTGPDTGGDGLWVGSDGGTYKLRLGKASGVGLRWTGSAVELRNSAGAAVIELDSSGNSRFAGPMTIGTSGGIWQGSGSFASPTTGLKIWNDGGVGRLATYYGGSPMISIDTNGRLVAGYVMLDADGMIIQSPSTLATPVSFKTYTGGVTYANFFSNGTSTSAITGIRSWRPSNINNQGYIGLHTNSVEGDKVQLAIVSAGLVANIVEVLPASTDSHKGLRVSGGVLIGSRSYDAPVTNVARFVEMASTSTFPNTVHADVFVAKVGGVQKLYVKFGSTGAIRELASA